MKNRQSVPQNPKLHNMEAKGLKYGINSVKIISSFIHSAESLRIKNLEERKIGINRGFQIGFDYSAGILTIKVEVDFICESEEQEPLKLFGTAVKYDYKFIDFEDILKKDEQDRVDIPEDLLVTLLSVSYSTTRGILITQTIGTEYSKHYLPLISIDEIKKIVKRIGQE